MPSAADSLALRDFLGVGLDQAPPDHSTISRTRRLIALETHRAVFTWILQCLSPAGLVKGKTIGIDATTLEANAALRSIVRRDSGESYEEFLTKLAKATGIGTPTRADLARIDRKRKKKGSNDDWTHPHDPDAKITKMKDGRTHLAHKAEHAIDLETGAIVGITVQGANEGDTMTIQQTLPEAAEQLEAVAAVTDDAVAVIEEVVADKGYHSRTTARSGDARDSHLHQRTGSRPAVVGGPARRTRRGLCESTPHSRRPRQATPPQTRRIARATMCASLRDGWASAGTRARPRERTQTPVCSCRRVQSRSLDAGALRCRHAAQPPGPRCGPRRDDHGGVHAHCRPPRNDWVAISRSHAIEPRISRR